MQINLLTKSDAKVVPYVIGGGGFGYAKVTGSARYGSSIVSVSASETKGLVGGGFGARLYAGSNWGIKPEFKIQRTLGGEGNLTLLRFSVGVFYQFGK